MKLDKGLIKDVDLRDMQDGSWRNALNIVEDIDGNKVNEEGTVLIYRLDINYSVIGRIETPEKTVVFSTDGSYGEIGTYTTGGYTKIVRDIYNNGAGVGFGFRKNNNIKGDYYFNGRGELIVVWTDGYNRPYLLNLDTLPFTVNAGTKIFNDTNDKFSLCYLFPNISLTRISISGYYGYNKEKRYYVSNTGTEGTDTTVKTASFVMYLRYKLQDDTYTRWICGQDIVTLVENQIFTVRVFTPDTRYTMFQLGFIKIMDGVVSAFHTSDYIVAATYVDINLNPVSSDLTSLATEELLIPSITFEKCQTLTQLNKRLIAGNITNRSVDFQKYANNIKLTWFSEGIYYYNVEPNSNSRFCFDEVYALYITLIFDDGSESEAFHIPGRINTDYSSDVLEAIGVTYTANEQDIATANGGLKRFHLRNDASSSSTHYLGYWENENETYPLTGNDIEVWEENPSSPGTGRQKISGETSISGKKVRHHRMPGFFATNGHVFYLRVNDLFIPSNISGVVGYYISYANRDKCKTILDYSIMNNYSFYINGMFRNNYKAHTVYARPFTILCEKPTLPSNIYIKQEISFNSVNPFLISLGEYGFATTVKRQYSLHSVSINIIVDTDTYSVIRITDYKYSIRFSETQPDSTYSYQQNMYHKLFHSCLELEIGSNDPYIVFPDMFGVARSDPFDFKYCSIRTIIKDLYTKVGTQQLIPAGYGGLNTAISGINYSLAYGYWRIGDTVFDLGSNDITEVKCRLDTILRPEQYGFAYPTNVREDYAFQRELCQLVFVGIRYSTNIGYDKYGCDTFKESWKIILLNEYNWYGHEAGKVLADVFVETDNDYEFCKLYPALNIAKNPVPHVFKDILTISFPHDIRRSIKQSDNTTQLDWRTFLANEYYRIEEHLGDITNLQGLNDTLVIQTEYTTYTAKLKDVLMTNNVDAYLGQGDIFDRVPERLIFDSMGYAGNQHQQGTCVFVGGFVYCDAKKGKIYIVSSEVKEISNTGISKLLKTLLLYVINNDTPYSSRGINITYDDTYKRLLISINSSTKSKCYSYSVANEYWISEHSYVPNGFFRVENIIHSFKTIGSYTGIFRHEVSAGRGQFYVDQLTAQGSPVRYESYIEPVFNAGYNSMSKLIQSVFWQSYFFQTVRELHYRTFTHIALYTSKHYTGIILLWDSNTGENYQTTDRYKRSVLKSKRDGIYRNSDGTWKFNYIRDMLKHNIELNGDIQNETPFIDDYGVLNDTQIAVYGFFDKPYYDKSLLIDKFVAVRLMYDNIDTAKVLLQDIEVNFKQVN